eukprot:scaffold19001_cov46-Prasinocladus_malaysianus.AAC.2
MPEELPPEDATPDSTFTRKHWARMNQSAKFQLPLYCGLLNASQGLVQMRGLGMFRLKGITDPVMLVQAWLPALDARSDTFPALSGAIGELRTKSLSYLLKNTGPDEHDSTASSMDPHDPDSEPGSYRNVAIEHLNGRKPDFDHQLVAQLLNT